MAKGQRGLRSLFITNACNESENDAASVLNSHLIALIELLPKIYGDGEPCRQAVLEIGTVVDMPCTIACLAAKRAMLLYAISSEASVSNFWKDTQDGSYMLAKDLKTRVLPFITPRFFRHCCQAPDQYVLMSLVLTEMWQGEDLGNFKACLP